MIEQPSDLKVSLFPHQLATVYRMERLERDKFVKHDNYKTYTDIGICADMTGYGKTISVVALILRDRMEWNVEHDYVRDSVRTFSDQHVKQFESIAYLKNNTTLVLAGSSVIHQWEREFAKTNLDCITVINSRTANSVQIIDYDVVLVTPNMFNRLWERYPKVAWKRFVYDEPTTVRIPSMKSIVAGFTWFITATPCDIYSRHRSCKQSYMYKIVNIGFEHIRPIITIKNDDNFIRQSFQMPPTHHIQYNCHAPAFRAIQGLVSDRVSKLIEAGNIAGAVQALGGQKTNNIIDLVKRIKIAELEDAQSKIKRWTILNDLEKIEEWKTRESEIIRQVNELNERFEKILDDRCSICYDNLNKPVMEPSCQNIFCGACLFTWLNRKGSCPLCRRMVNKEDLIYIEREDEKEEKVNDEEKKEKLPTKEETIIKIIKEKQEGKFIIFSKYDESFEPIRNVLKENKIPFIEIKGIVETRTKNIERFRKGDINVAFLNSNTDSSGINMQETTDIIIYHTMGEATKNQILGRANRIGRKIPLYVHNLLSGT